MNAFITFYRLENKILTISNSFSFGREYLGKGIDFFIEQKSPVEEIASQLTSPDIKFKKIYCSVNFNIEFETIRPLIEDNWIIGGPAVVDALSSKKDGKGLLEKETLESYSGKTNLSSKFNPYFKEFVDKMIQKYDIESVQYFCSISKGCYWDKCNFCHYKHYATTYYTRPNVTKIINSLPKFSKKSLVHLGTETPTSSILRDILKANIPKNILLELPIRADKGLIKELKKSKSAKGILFRIGVEALGQVGQDKLNKGMKVENILEFIDLALRKEGSICLLMMDLHAFANKKMVDEGLDFLNKLKKIYRNHLNRTREKEQIKKAICPATKKFVKAGDLFFENNGITCWATRKQSPAAPHGFVRTGYSLYNQWHAKVPINTKEFEYNKILSQAMLDSGITCIGRKMAALYPEKYPTVTKRENVIERTLRFSKRIIKNDLNV